MKYKNYYQILLLGVVMLYYSCADKLRLAKTPFSENQLRIDGYYYHKASDSKCYNIYFFYTDGVVLYGGGDSSQPLGKREMKFSNEDWIKFVENTQTWWGVYQIEGNSIKFEMWYPSNTWYLLAYISSGKILNDTTFVITSSERSSRFWSKGSMKENDMYHFRKFSPKPDSTNRFIPSDNKQK